MDTAPVLSEYEVNRIGRIGDDDAARLPVTHGDVKNLVASHRTLQAALDAVLNEAETFASKLLTMYRFAGLDEEQSELMQEVKAFLSSPAVRDYRARQEQG